MNEVVIYDKMQDPMLAIEKMGKFIAASRMFNCETVDQGCVIAMTCMAQRIDPFQFKRTYHIFKGTNEVVMRSDAMLAEFNNRGGRHQWVHSDRERATLRLWHPETYPEPFEITVTLKELVDNGIAMSPKNPEVMKDNYRHSSDAMLRARCTSKGIRAVMPSVVAGIYTPEEMSDFTPVEEVVVKPSAPAKPLLAAPEPQTETANGEIERIQLAELLTSDLADAGLLDAARDFCRGKRMIGDEADIDALPLATLRAIHDRKDSFINKVRESANNGQTAAA